MEVAMAAEGMEVAVMAEAVMEAAAMVVEVTAERGATAVSTRAAQRHRRP